MVESALARTPVRQHTLCDSLFRYAEFLKFGEVHVKIDEATGLKAIVAIHNLKLGPAIGGCRFVTYATADKAIEDALRLAQMMSFKSAANNLPHGGGKAVLIKPKRMHNHEAYFEKFGEFVNSLGGNYITAVDSGTSPADMDIVARRTKFVTCTTDGYSDPSTSLCTARGVRRGIEAAVKFKLDKDSLEGIHVAIQGAGHVGYLLAKDLTARGARLTMCDVNAASLQHCIDEFAVATCSPDVIYDIKADVFAPCALGAVLNLETIKRLQVPIVCGSANNQLAHHHYGTLLHERDILYVPDFIANAGGIIQVAVLYGQGDIKRVEQQIDDIYGNLMGIFEQAAQYDKATNEFAEKMALDKLR